MKNHDKLSKLLQKLTQQDGGLAAEFVYGDRYTQTRGHGGCVMMFKQI